MKKHELKNNVVNPGEKTEYTISYNHQLIDSDGQREDETGEQSDILISRRRRHTEMMRTERNHHDEARGLHLCQDQVDYVQQRRCTGARLQSTTGCVRSKSHRREE